MESRGQLIDQFKAFCESAGPALERSLPKPPLDEFRSFVDSARQLLLKSVHDQLHVIQEALRCLEPWLLEDRHDLLRVAQLTLAEDPYTELLAWAIDPKTHDEIGNACQRGWLKSLCLTGSGTVKPVSPRTQLSTDTGIPDLVLEYQAIVVIVEAKTKTDEHIASKSEFKQTKAYPAAVCRRLQKSEHFPVSVVYLTTDRSKAANSQAINTSYFELAVSLAQTLNGLEVLADLKSLYKLIITHFATQTATLAVDVRKLFFLTDERQNQDRVIDHVTSLTHMLHLLPERTAE